MTDMIGYLPLLAPAALLAAAIVARGEPGMRPRATLRAARLATLAALGIALISTLGAITGGAWTAATPFGLSVRVDALSATMFLLVAFVGAVVTNFSRNYLDGDPRQGLFTGRLCLTLAAVMLLVTAGNLTQLLGAWIATSLALHTLLVFREERRAAVAAARKKWYAARAGDVALAVAALTLAKAYGTGDIAAIAEAARAGEGGVSVGLAAVLIALAALLKSAQFPAHGWLPEVMETPTPVSALLHAGIINAGGFLVVRFADVMVLSPLSMHLLALVGGFTALFGAVVMLTRPSVKVSLAWSTVAQMGFMLLQCGLGAFALAVLHIVAHSLYKAHAFLSSGSVIDIARTFWTVAPGGLPRRTTAVSALAAALALFVGVGWLFGMTAEEDPALLTLGAIMVMGLTLLIAQAMMGRPNSDLLGRVAGAAVGVTVAWYALHAAAQWVMAGAVPPIPEAGPVRQAVMLLALGSFGFVTALQLAAPAKLLAPAWRAAWVHLGSGLYVNAWIERRMGAWKRTPGAAA